MSTVITAGIIGFGTVGSGTARILVNNREYIKDRTGIDIRLKRIADLDITTDRGVPLAPGVLTANAKDILDDPEIDIVIELIGGIHPAKDFMLEALKKGKHVVTANKALLAREGAELFAEADKRNLSLGFEAAVAGGIPIIKVLREGLAANRILAVYGIINGTSNYILTKMAGEGVDFGQALQEAQRLGYAEADPTFDIEGIDTAHKLALIATLCYGIPLSFDRIYTEGITKITAEDILFARELGYKIKLLAITKISGGKVELRVHPTMVPETYPIAKVEDVFNALYVMGDAVGETLYYGRGAGDMPTGSAVVSDVIDIGRMHGTGRCLRLKTGQSSYTIKEMKDIVSMYYFRFNALDKPGVLSTISGVLGSHDIGISAVIQKGRKEGEGVPLVVLTHKAREEDVLVAIDKIDRMPVVTARTKFIRVEGKDT